jgi:hypothetical protein
MSARSSVLARDQHGDKFYLEVLEQQGRVVLRDGTFVRIMTHRDAADLAAKLLIAVPPESEEFPRPVRDFLRPHSST